MSEGYAVGCGAAVTFVSKSTVNTVISTVQWLVQETIPKEAAEVGCFLYK